MPYLGDAVIDEALVFYANTHDPTTGGAVDADSPPAYRVYELETGTPLLTGSMALLDDANTVGFYSESITLSAANGFEVGKTYCIRKLGIVDSIEGVEIDTFKVVPSVTLNGDGYPVTALGAVEAAGETDIETILAASYTAEDLARETTAASAAASAGAAQTAAESADGKLPALTANNLVPVDVKRINAVELTGDGDGTPMGAA